MSVDRELDSVTGDFVDGGRVFAICSPLQNKVLFSFTVPLGAWEGDPALGHRFAELARAIDSSATRARLSDLIVAAVQWLLDSGELASVVPTVLEYARGAIAWTALLTAADGSNFTVGPLFTPIGVG